MKKENIFTFFLMAVTFVFVTVSGIIFKQSFLRMLPLYVSLVVSVLQSRVNRYAPLIGGINSIIYAIVYMFYHLYASAIYALLVSCPLQIITFVLWNKHPWQNSTMLKRLNVKARIIIVAGTVASWVTIYYFLSRTNSSHRELDTAATVLGIISTILMMLSYYEYTAVMLFGGICSISLYIAMLKDNPEQITYLCYSVYSQICVIMAFIKVHSIYDRQQKNNMTI